MKRAEDIERVFKKAGLGIGPDADERIFADVLQARRQIPQNPRTVFDRGRTIMRSPFTKVAVAAIVLVACLIGVSLWKQTGSGLALADVLARMEQVPVYRLKMSTTFQREGAKSMRMGEVTMLVSRTRGQRVTIRLDHPVTGESLLQELYVSPQERTITAVMPNQKTYAKVELDDAGIERWQSENDPRTFVERMLQFEHKRLGRSVVDGIEVEGFQATDPRWVGEAGGMAGAEIKAWADVESRLPVRIEIDRDTPGKGHIHVAAYDFEWDVPVDAAQFVPVVPDDYTPGQPLLQIVPGK